MDVKAVEDSIFVEVELSEELASFVLPPGVQRRLQSLLDKQDHGELLSDDEQLEAEGLVDLADLLCLLRLRTIRSQEMERGRGQ